MTTVADLIERLQKMPQHLSVGSKELDRAGETFQPGIMIERRHLKSSSDRLVDGDAPGGAEEVVVLF